MISVKVNKADPTDLYEQVAAEIRRAPDGCLTLERFFVGRGAASASGRERNLFEHSLVLRVRRADVSVAGTHGKSDGHDDAWHDVPLGQKLAA